MKKTFYTILFCLLFTAASAQYETVVFNYERAYFNEGQPLPAESNFILTGDAGNDVDMVELKIFSSPDMDNSPLFQKSWTKRATSPQNTFTIPVNYPLRGGDKYTLVLNFYKRATDAQQRELMRQLDGALRAYIDQSYVVKRNRVDLLKHPKTIRNDLNAIAEQGLSFYRNQINYEFRGFSDLVLEKLKQIEDLRLNEARRNIFARADDSKREIRLKYAQEQIEALKTLIGQEVAQYANTSLLFLVDTKVMADYATEKTRNTIAINAGYGAVYYSGEIDNFTSDTAPYAGFSFPLGKAPFAGPFWTKSSISAGVFLTNLDFVETTEATGPLVRRPVYLALGYRILPFLRFNAGATLLQNGVENNAISDLNIDRMYVRPFVGLSLEVNLWLNLNR